MENINNFYDFKFGKRIKILKHFRKFEFGRGTRLRLE